MRTRGMRGLAIGMAVVGAGALLAVPAGAGPSLREDVTLLTVANPAADDTFSASGGALVLTNHTTGDSVSCTSATLSGSIFDAVGVRAGEVDSLPTGDDMGTVEDGSFGGCSASDGSPATVGYFPSPFGLGWSIAPLSHDAGTGRTAVWVGLVTLTVATPGCEYSVVGTMTGSYTNASQALTLGSDANLNIVSNPTGPGCGGAAYLDVLSLSRTTYTVAPAITVEESTPSFAVTDPRNQRPPRRA